MTDLAPRCFVRLQDGAAITAAQFDGRVAGFSALLAVFPDRVRPHPHRDDALLVLIGDRKVRIEAGDWIAEAEGGEITIWPDDQFGLLYGLSGALAA